MLICVLLMLSSWWLCVDFRVFPNEVSLLFVLLLLFYRTKRLHFRRTPSSTKANNNVHEKSYLWSTVRLDSEIFKYVIGCATRFWSNKQDGGWTGNQAKVLKRKSSTTFFPSEPFTYRVNQSLFLALSRTLGSVCVPHRWRHLLWCEKGWWQNLMKLYPFSALQHERHGFRTRRSQDKIKEHTEWLCDKFRLTIKI